VKLSEETLRQEIKYKVFLKDVSKLYAWLYSSSFFKESYNPRYVNSLYFDTSNYDFASSNMSGESKRIKIRARWYGGLNENFLNGFLSDAKVFNFEVKRKINSLSDKLNIGEIKFDKEDVYTDRVASIQNELDLVSSKFFTLSAFKLFSTVFTSYEREYYELNGDNKIRLTIDKNISYCNSKAPSNLLILAKDYLIVELKFHPEQRNKVNKLMNDFPFRQVRSSKFLASLAQLQRVSY
jgi:SPX domain protein involved in polyphosphate accumulation